MRHGKAFNHLSRKKGHRSALLRNLAGALIKYKRISTTVAKAKALRVYIEPLITKSKNNSTHSRRIVFSYLQNKDVVASLFGEVAEKVATRPGGYTRVIRTGFRKGDGAEMAMIELVDFNNIMVSTSVAESPMAKTAKRTRRSAKKTKSEAEGAVENSTEELNSEESETKE
ncbi:MAG: 50S ribosomal protein L17 [Saprospiraceae bacterium]|nr:50S ribosomal protein L17 [Candidatus Vicinibacter affinis]MBK9961259.1 50S ribosomal protein L17 [Candidatus Vicinibacter affinis]MBP6521843.1 50S ribosomal protein L17 [Saprospiraceae bacterium]